MKTIFNDRKDAGQALAQRLIHFIDEPDVLVLGLPRGGVEVGYEIARRLRLPLDVFQVRKLGVPGKEELAMGAIASGGVRVLNFELIDSLRISLEEIEQTARREAEVIHQRELLYSSDQPSHSIREKTTILVDDAIITGATMKAAVLALRQLNPKRIVVAVPVTLLQVVWELQTMVDQFVTVLAPARSFAIGDWYKSLPPMSDLEVSQLLKDAAEPVAMMT